VTRSPTPSFVRFRSDGDVTTVSDVMTGVLAAAPFPGDAWGEPAGDGEAAAGEAPGDGVGEAWAGEA
jgi:hypothetical protein